MLAGCAVQTPPPVSVPLRNPTAPVASQTDATLLRLAGDWRVVSGAGMAPGTRLRFASHTVTIDGKPVDFAMTAAGRMRLDGETIWVHWLDADNRTAAMGEPGGARVWIMDRTGHPGDRLRAARKILEWYGYDLSRMEDT